LPFLPRRKNLKEKFNKININAIETLKALFIYLK
jgi:hypothetical protein